MAIAASNNGEPVAILNRNEPIFYCVSAEHYENLMDAIDDLNLVNTINSRAHEKERNIDLNDL